jgi:Na+/proline symporter
LVVFVLCGLLAAIMSTASSVVLTLSSIFTRDIYQTTMRQQASHRELAMVGRLFVVVILVLVVIASTSSTATLWRLTEIKIEFLMQLFPALILGLYWRRITRWPAIWGILGGSLIAATMMLTGHARWWLFQAGLYGFLVNLAICVVATWCTRPADTKEQQRLSRDFFGIFNSNEQELKA